MSTSNTTNTTTKFNVSIAPKTVVKEVHLFYGTDASKIKKITTDTPKNSGDGYGHKLLKKYPDGKNLDSYSFDTKNETNNHHYIKLKPGTTYYYKVCVKLGNGNYYITGRNSFTTKADKPAAVTSLSLDHSDAKYALEEQVTVSWKESKEADKYKVYLYDKDGKAVSKNENCTKTTWKVKAPATAGTYTVKVFASNEAGDSKETKKSLQVMAGLTQTFKYDDGGKTPDETKTVKYNASVMTPALPSRTGYTFLGWVSSAGKTYGAKSTIKNIVKNETYTANWRKNKYRVKLIDGITNSQIGDAITLEYGETFCPAEYVDINGISIPVHAGYTHTGYSEEEYTVTDDSTQEIYALYSWESLNSLSAEITSIVRAREKTDLEISDGYSVDVKVTAPGTASNGSGQPVKGRIVVALKTDAGRLLIETESAAFVLYPQKTAVSQTINVFVPYEAAMDKYPTQAEAFVVNNYYAAGIISNVADGTNLLAAANSTQQGWSQTTEPVTAVGQQLSNGDIVAEFSSAQDRNDYTKTVTTYKTALGNGEANYSWVSEVWKPMDNGTVTYVKSWPKLGTGLGCGFVPTYHQTFGSNSGTALYDLYNKKAVSAVTYPTRRVTTSEKVVGYLYYHWCRGLDTGDLQHTVKNVNKTTENGKNVYNKFEAFYSVSDLPQETYNDTTYYCAKNKAEFKNYSKDSYYYFRIPVYQQTWKEEYKVTTWKKTETSVVTANTQPAGGTVITPITHTMNGLVNSSKVYQFTESSKELNYKAVTSYTLKQRRYAYKPSVFAAHHEDINLQDAMTIDVGTAHAGETAVVYIYKDRQAADYTTEYIDAVTVDANGMVTIAGPSGGQLQTREEISSETGDFTVAIALYGETNARVVRTIPVPVEKKPLYTVEFQADVETTGTDADGNEVINMETVTLETQSVREGQNAEYPAESLIPQKEGYHFTGWSESLNNVRGDMAIKAQYEIDEYSVVFVNWQTQQADLQKRNYRDAVAAPELPEPPEGLDVRWVVLGDDSSVLTTLEQYESDGNVVTGDMVVAAEYFTKMVELKVVHLEEALSAGDATLERQKEILQETEEMDFDTINTRESIETYPVTTESMAYSDVIPLTDYESAYDDNIVIVGWKSASHDGQELDTAEITDDLTIYPVYRFAETAEEPEADIATGEYEEAQEVTLSSETDNAVIYYTTDGSDPATSDTAEEYIYGETVTIDKSCTLKACAMALGMNNSSTMEEIYAVNSGDGVSHHIVTIYSNIMEDLEGYIFRAMVRDGARLDISALEELENYTFAGLYYDEAYTEEFLADSETITETLDLYAKYIPKQYTVTFADEDGTVYSEQQVDYGTVAEAPENPAKEGYIFIAWDPDVSEPIQGDTTFTALFVAEDEYATVKLNRSKLSSIVGASRTLTATVSPEGLEDVELLWESSDEEVAEVDQNGKVTFTGTGEAEITVTVVSTREKATCAVTVMENSDTTIVLARTSQLDKDAQGYIRRVQEQKNTVAAIRNQFVNDGLQFYGMDGRLLEEDELVGTGTLIRLADGETILDEARVVMTGDVNGDGRIQNRDASLVAQLAAGETEVEEYQGLAADVNGDGFVNAADSAMITRYLVGKEMLG